jgi:hypothetical protein
MPIIDAVIVAAIIVAFVIFGAVLAWAESQTSNLPRLAPKSVAKTTPAYRPATVH